MLVQTPESWVQLIDLLFGEPWPEHAGLYHSNLAHRGMSNANHGLQTSLERRALQSLEGNLLRNFQKYSRMPAGPSMSQWDWLTIAQHHGLPTRVLDWTYSPMVALHFATNDIGAHDDDGAVWSVDVLRAHQLIPSELTQVLTEQDATIFTTELLSRVVENPAQLDNLTRSPFTVFFEPPSIDERVVNQFASLSIAAGGVISMDEWVNAHQELTRKIVIPAELKAEAREKLDQANVSERTLFPGLDGLCQWLTRYYCSRERSFVS